MTRWRGMQSARVAVARMRDAYAAGDIVGLVRAYQQAPRESRLLRVALPLLGSFYPVAAFLELAEQLDGNIAEDGLHEGCRRFLRDLAIGWECDLPERHRAIAETQPVIFYGNHPSLLTPFLVAAGVERHDLRFFSSSYACHLIRSLSDVSYPMEVPLTRSWTEWRRGGWKRVLAYRLLSLLHDVPDAETTKAINRRSLELGSSHVRRGGSAMICPGGGGKRDRYWYPGIGSLVKRLQESPGDREVYLLPIREENCTNKRVYAQLMEGPVARLKRSTFHRGPVRILFADPIPLRDIGSTSSSVEQIVEILRTHYESLFAEPAIAMR